MAENVRQKISEWAEKFNQERAEGNLEEIFEELCQFIDETETTQVEKIVLLINQCIVLDALNRDRYEDDKKTYTREDIVEEIKIFYEEFIQSSIIDEWENDSILAFKERISYLIALILYKVHNYEEAYQYFVKSRKFSEKLGDTENENGLSLLYRIKRDIHFAYCCEYIGMTEEPKEELVEALEILLGAGEESKGIDRRWEAYWQKLKEYCYARIDRLEEIFSSSEALEQKAVQIISELLEFSRSERCVFHRLIEMRNRGEKVECEYTEAVHVLAHCLNELNMGMRIGGNDSAEAMENYEKRNLMKMISCVCIDSLGERYATCQATIRAEQGNGIDAISRMHKLAMEELSEQDRAEIDFYQYYFELMFPHQSYEKVHKHGDEFYEFCKKNYESDRDNFQDGLLHYYVVSLRRELKFFLDEIVDSTNRNALFFQKKMRESECFQWYEKLRKREFSHFVNVQMIHEREKLIIVYKILRNLQNSKLPLFYEYESFDENLVINENIEELYNLCKKFNRYFKVNTESLEAADAECCRNEASGEERSGHDSIKAVENTENADDLIRNSVSILVEGLTFELYGNIAKLKSYFEKCEFTDFKIWDGKGSDTNKLNLENKILYVDDAGSCVDCCLKLYRKTENKNIRIFYVGKPDKDLDDKKIGAFGNINICFLMAYIYGSIGRIFDYIFHPTPIYILAPLRDVSNYEFQEAKFDSLLKYPSDYSESIEVQRGGIGISYQKKNVKEDYFGVKFLNNNIQNACIGLIKLYDDKLYIMREERLVRKETAHIGLVNKMYNDYADARKPTEDKRHSRCTCEFCVTSRCAYFYKQISDENFTRKKQNAAEKLRYLFYFACEEHAPLTDECYLLQSSFDLQNRIDGDGFQICIFDKDIRNFLPAECCLKEVVSVTEVSPDMESKGDRRTESREGRFVQVSPDMESKGEDGQSVEGKKARPVTKEEKGQSVEEAKAGLREEKKNKEWVKKSKSDNA